MNWGGVTLAAFVAVGAWAALGLALARPLLRWLAHRAEVMMGRPPQLSGWEWLFSLASTAPRELALTVQRAERGEPAQHPMGSPKGERWLDRLAWDPATLQPEARPPHTVSTAVTVGPRAARPLRLALPVLPAPMAYGLALTAEAKIALAEATTVAGTAASSGEGPFLPEERACAARWIHQASRADWPRQAPLVALADMVELQVGQGSEASATVSEATAGLPERVVAAARFRSRVVIAAGLPQPLTAWLADIRAVRADIPVGVKLPATGHVEQDVLRLAQWGVDAITLDGAEAATAHSVAVIHDASGIPTALAVRRADRALRAAGLRHRLTLIASGGLRGAGDIAKVLALGADAAIVGTSLLVAASHGQVAKVFPAGSPSALTFVTPPAARRPRFDRVQAVSELAGWFRATEAELRLLAGALAVERLAELGPERLVAHDAEVAAALGLVHAGQTGWPVVNLRLSELALLYQGVNGLLRDLARNLRRGMGAAATGEAKPDPAG